MPLMRSLIKRWGIVGLTSLLTATAILFSWFITLSVNWMITGSLWTLSGILVATLAPGIMVPLFSYYFLNLFTELEETREGLLQLARLDSLTRTYNRRFFLEMANTALEEARQDGNPFVIALIDIDNFKEINDRFGHLVGDQVLLSFSRICRKSIRSSDLLARFGGDEFVLLFRNTTAPQARQILERLRRAARTQAFAIDGKPVQPTFSIGMQTWQPSITCLDMFLAGADEALYQAKRQGKDRIVAQ
jgi:diguanylate cyclase (GGDEF)-like protein